MKNKSGTAEKFSRNNWLILLLFGMMGQIAWTVENMFFNVFAYETVAPNLDAVSLMVQLSGIVATAVTLLAGVLSDKMGNRRSLISWGYIIWGVTVGLFGCISNSLTETLFGISGESAVQITLILIIAADCVMTGFGSAANDAAFNAWVTDNTKPSYRGTVEGVLSILPLLAMLIVAGGFGIIKDLIGYRNLFLALGVVISLVGIVGLVKVKDAPTLEKSGGFKDIFYGFKPSAIKDNKAFYVTLLVVMIHGIATQIFMPYIIIFMTEYLGFSAIEYSIAFGGAILAGAGLNLYLSRLSDRRDKVSMIYIAAAIFSAGLIMMYFASMIKQKTALIILFAAAGFVMISGYIFVTALSGSIVRDYTPKHAVGKLQGVRMVFSVLVPMLVGPAVGNAINATTGIAIDAGSADAMTTNHVPAPEIFLVGGLVALLIIAVVPLLKRIIEKQNAAADKEQ